jgi:hypothetical protein
MTTNNHIAHFKIDRADPRSGNVLKREHFKGIAETNW